MVRAWYMDNIKVNPKDPHHRLPPKFVTLEDLYQFTGVEYEALNVESYETELNKIKKERGFPYEDELETPDNNDLRNFYKEHLHKDDEIRFVLDGCAYYDFRDVNDEWIRVEVLPGDLIIIPSGCYHRFTLDHTNIFRAKRLFQNDNIYRTFERPKGGQLKCRKVYLDKLAAGGFN